MRDRLQQIRSERANAGDFRLDLRLDDSRMHTSEQSPVIGTDENNVPIRASEFIHTKVDAKLTLAPNQAVLAQGVKTISKNGNAQTLVIVAVRVIELELKSGK